ncbi:FecR family protein [Methylophilus rhizosphaerae]|uniref:FecR family protein n=2 Tax=Methylophilus rhizosphaerae TaxID=492660 RepID=A0A1G9BNY1_9PROT|nr:FecR family protein [Methylophilus rhizosphaerae]
MSVSDKTALQAAEWFFRLQESDTTHADHAACRAWREADATHEIAWQRAVEVSQKMSRLPGNLAYSTLQNSHQTGRRRAIKALAILLTTGTAGWQTWQSEPARMLRAEYRTHTGEQQRVQLADGTEMHLNTSTGLNTRFDQMQRLIVLEAGEIMVQTGHHDPLKRPLVIATRYGELRPLGTRFTVRQRADDVHLVVLDGAVEVINSRGQRRVINAGWQTYFDQQAIATPVVADSHMDSWTRGILHVREMRLAEFATEMARYRNGIVRCAPGVADLKISGAFQLKNTDEVFASLPTILPVKVSYLTRYWITLDALEA